MKKKTKPRVRKASVSERDVEVLQRLESVLSRDRDARASILSVAVETYFARLSPAFAVVTAFGLTPRIHEYEEPDVSLPPGNVPFTEGVRVAAGELARIRPQRPTCYTEIRVSGGWVIARVQKGNTALAFGPCESVRIRETLRVGEELQVHLEREQTR